MADLPNPNHAIAFGYYLDWSFYGNFRSEIIDRVDTLLVWDYVMGGDLAALDASMANAAASGKTVLFGPNISPAENTFSSAALDGVDTVAAYWADIDAIYFDEPGGDMTWVGTLLTNWATVLSDRSLASKPIWINFTSTQITGNDGWQASGIDVIGIEAYLEATDQNNDVATLVTAELTALKATIRDALGTPDLFYVIQGYNRNGTWTNATSLRDLQTPPYIDAHDDTDVVGLLVFSWGRPGGTRDLPLCIRTEHERIWGAINDSSQPASMNCAAPPPPSGRVLYLSGIASST